MQKAKGLTNEARANAIGTTQAATITTSTKGSDWIIVTIYKIFI